MGRIIVVVAIIGLLFTGCAYAVGGAFVSLGVVQL